MAKTLKTPEQKLKDKIEKTKYSNEISFLDKFLKYKGKKIPFQFAMKALFEFITDGEPFEKSSVYIGFINEIRTFLMCPEIAAHFYKHANVRPKGVNQYLRCLNSSF